MQAAILNNEGVSLTLTDITPLSLGTDSQGDVMIVIFL